MLLGLHRPGATPARRGVREYARDPEHPFASWFATYADPAFEDATRTAIAYAGAAASSSGADTAERMRRAFTTSSAHERAFFAAPMEPHRLA
ncbi:hypothetical protein [Microbacterium sp. Se5.02b]|uniref:hypothetical protein n=1 Tax=Microbacterium sp. Se5.02b TaxID=2864103 RepID=UPI00215DB6C2|nr:hypothetical protein [Microbacterium sp. Se5.02b]